MEMPSRIADVISFTALALVAAGLLSGCADAPPISSEASDESSDPEDIDPAFFRNEGLYSLKSNVTTVAQLSRSGACSTAAAGALTRQIAQELACMRPGAFVRIDGTPNVSFSASAMPYLQPTAATALRQAAQSRSMTVNSAWRSVAQQYLLKSWEGRCGIRLAASPGRSNHESGLAVDVDNYETPAIRNALGAAGLTWFCRETNGGRLGGCADPVHFTDHNGEDLRTQGVKAFQRLWNRNHPEDRIAEDGDWGAATASRMARAPINGFAQIASCGAAPGDGAAVPANDGNGGDNGAGPAPSAPSSPPADACGGLDDRGVCEGDRVARCVSGRVVRTDCAALSRICTVDETGAVCLRPDQAPDPGNQGGGVPANPAPPADPCAGMPLEGICSGSVAYWCDGGQLRQHDCSVSGQSCGYVDSTLGYYCVASPAGDSAGSPPADPPPPADPAPAPADPAPVPAPAPAAAADNGYQASGECVPTPLDNYSAPNTDGPANESVGRCVQRQSRLGLNVVDCRYPAANGPWYLTTFGGGGDTQNTACGGRQADGTWFYAANAHRFGCGARFRLWTDTGCAIVETADIGANVCVEEAAGGPVWDVSPAVARVLTGSSQAGWSDHTVVYSEPVDRSTPLGACQ